MNKSIKNITNTNEFVIKNLKKLIKIFPKHYELLANNGEKNEFHKFVIKNMVPPFSISSIRAYCSDLNRIPEKKRLFLSFYIAGKLVLFIQKKRDKEMRYYQRHINNLQKTLKAFDNEKEEKKTTQA